MSRRSSVQVALAALSCASCGGHTARFHGHTPEVDALGGALVPMVLDAVRESDTSSAQCDQMGTAWDLGADEVGGDVLRECYDLEPGWDGGRIAQDPQTAIELASDLDLFGCAVRPSPVDVLLYLSMATGFYDAEFFALMGDIDTECILRGVPPASGSRGTSLDQALEAMQWILAAEVIRMEAARLGHDVTRFGTASAPQGPPPAYVPAPSPPAPANLPPRDALALSGEATDLLDAVVDATGIRPQAVECRGRIDGYTDPSQSLSDLSDRATDAIDDAIEDHEDAVTDVIRVLSARAVYKLNCAMTLDAEAGSDPMRLLDAANRMIDLTDSSLTDNILISIVIERVRDEIGDDEADALQAEADAVFDRYPSR